MDWAVSVISCLLLLLGFPTLFYCWLVSESASAKRKKEALLAYEVKLRQAQSRLDLLIPSLSSQRELEEYRNEFFQLAHNFPEVRGRIYQGALNAIEKSGGDTTIKKFCLEIGRQFYGGMRPDGKPTIYDEQAMASDIAMRSN